MALNNQINIYSVDTSAFYTHKENELHWKINKLRNEKYRLNDIIFDIEYKLAGIGIYKKEKYNPFKEIKSKTYNYNSYKDDEITYIEYLVNKMYYYIKIKSIKTKKITENKDKLLYLFKVREKKNDFKETRYIRRLNDTHIKEKNVISVFESSLTRMLNLKKDDLTKDILIVQVYYFDIIKDIIKNTFYLNGEKYKYLTSSAGQIRTKKTVFIKQELWNMHEKTLMCGLSIEKINEHGGINVNKFLAYLALSNSATDLWEDFDITKTIVVPDFETNVNGTFDFINDSDYSITRKTDEVPITHTDGCGLISSDISKKNFMVRLPWVKGLLASFDFKRFIREADGASPIVKDIYGNEHDIIQEDIQIIFTESQFKMHKYYADWNQYIEYFQKYDCTAGKCNEEEDKISTAKINYQMIQTLTDTTTDEIKNISKLSVKKLEELATTVKSMLYAFGITPFNQNKTWLQQALEIYPELLQDIYLKETIRQIKKSLVNDYKSAKLEVRGKFTFLVPDLYAFCEHLFCGIEVPKGLLDDGEIFCNLYPKSEKLDCLRSPHLFKEHAVRKNVVDEEKSKWFTSDAIYTSTYDLISKVLQFDNDGDKSLIISDKMLICIAERNMKDIVPLYYNMRKADPIYLSNEEIYNGLKAAYTGGNIGAISNDITKIWNSDVWYKGSKDQKEEALEIVKLLCMENNFTIDYAKTLYKPQRPKEINSTIRKYTKSKTPFFFQYAKGKTLEQVERKNKSVVNQLDDIIEDKRLKFSIADFGRFDYKVLMNNPDIEIDSKVIEKYNVLNKKYHFKINMENEYNNNISYIANEIREELNEYGYSVIEITDMIIKQLYHVKNSKCKESLWFCYGNIIVSNIKQNIENKTSVCLKCGCRFEPHSPSQKYCIMCDNKYQPIGTKTIQCIDCGCDVEIDAKDNETCRCNECKKIYIKERDRLRKKAYRENLSHAQFKSQNRYNRLF